MFSNRSRLGDQHRHAFHMHRSKVRVVHNVANGPDVDIYLDGKMVLSDVPYTKVSDFLSVPPGNHQILVTAAGSNDVLFGANVDLRPGLNYTVIAHGLAKRPDTLALLTLEDDRSCPARGKAHVRFIHAAAGAPAVDVYATGPTLLFDNVSYGKTGNPTYLPVDAGKVDLGVTAHGSDELVLGPIPFTLGKEGNYTLIATGIVGDDEAPLGAILIDDTRKSCVYVHH